MNHILGLNGVYPRSHDTSACIVKVESGGAEILANAEEERFGDRDKRAFDKLPLNSTRFCLEQAALRPGDIDIVTWGWDAEKLSSDKVLPPEYPISITRRIETVKVPHHEAHAASVFYTSPFDKAAILVVDGQGEKESTTIWKGSRESGLEKVLSIGVDRSLGYLYGAISRFCGLGSFGAGKVMGLAPYGIPHYLDVLEEVYNGLRLPEQEGHDSQVEFFKQFISGLEVRGFKSADVAYVFDKSSGKTRPEPFIDTVHRDMAASVQAYLEQQMLQLANKAHAITGLDNLCLAGGVAMNCVTNSVIQDSGPFKEIFLQPGCEDNGVAMGAALAVAKLPAPFETPYLGPSFSDEEISTALDRLGVNYTTHDNIESVTAELLAIGSVVGWFQGGLEFGPRALGGRSIIAHPGTLAMKNLVNSVKQREQWRPFGPSVLADHADELFDHAYPSPYMLRSFKVREEWRERMPAVVHVDGTTRPQTVTPEAHPRYHGMIKAFELLTGIPAVLNTSFNNYDEPLVATPLDALKTFASSRLQALVLGNNLVQKR